MVFRVHQEGQRDLKNLVHFRRIEREVKAGPNNGQHRLDAKARTGNIIRQTPHGLYERARKPDFLFRLAQRRLLRRAVLGVDTAAREGNLTGMLAQGGGALGEDHPRVLAVIDNGNQNRRVLQFDAVAGQHHARIENVIAIFPLGNALAFLQHPPAEVGGGKTLQRRHCHCESRSSSLAGMTGKTTPPERTANMSTPSTLITSPSATRSYITARDTSASRRPRTRR
ncbi:hypothetical protein AT6N2_C3399 [Agrobacterium tumefaciens]|nr:hypothetical protein AT6N2_C3399 [Agrobacterium tumefaciens]